LSGCRQKRRQWLADREPHGGDFLLLGDDDFLGEPPDLRVATVAKHGDGHVDRALMGGTIIATKSASRSPVGVTAISLIIFFIAAAFSARNGASPPKSFAAVAQSSGLGCDPSCAKATNAVAAARAIASVPAAIGAKRRKGKLIPTSPMFNQVSLQALAVPIEWG